MSHAIARIAAAGRIVSACGLLGWSASTAIVAAESGAPGTGWSAAFMAGAYGLAGWLLVAVALLPVAWLVAPRPAAASFNRATWLWLVTCALAMALCFGPLALLARWLMPQSWAYHELLGRAAAAYGAWAFACALGWIVWLRWQAGRAPPAWCFAVAFVAARELAAEPLAQALPGRQTWLDAGLLIVCSACAFQLATRVPRAAWLALGSAWAGSVIALCSRFDAHPAARAELVEHYVGAAGLIERLASLYDLDGDGVSGWLGGADCDDLDPKVSPFQLEITGNGVDDNCLGGDLKAAEAPQLTAAGAAPRHNLVLITLDTTRADLVDAAYMPRLAGFASQAALFTRAYTLVPYTNDSTRTMLTGQPLMSMAVTYSQDLGREPSLQEHLRAAGYDTSIVLHRWWTEAGSWWAYQGFQQRLEAAPEQKDPYRSVTGPQVTELALAELTRLAGAGRPYFLWIHYIDPHAEYMPREGTPFSHRAGLRQAYLQEVWATDRELGRVLDHLERLHFFDTGVLAVHSDHGELVERDRAGHALWLDEGVLRVVLALRGPSIPAGRYATRVTLVDLFPTLLELTSGTAAASFGRSLAPVWFRRETDDREVFVYSPYPGSRQGALLQGHHKLVQDFLHGTERLHDLASDPGERVNLIEAEPRIAARLRARYAEVWDQSMNDRVLARRARRRLFELCERGSANACTALRHGPRL